MRQHLALSMCAHCTSATFRAFVHRSEFSDKQIYCKQQLEIIWSIKKDTSCPLDVPNRINEVHVHLEVSEVNVSFQERSSLNFWEQCDFSH